MRGGIGDLIKEIKKKRAALLRAKAILKKHFHLLRLILLWSAEVRHEEKKVVWNRLFIH